MHFSLPSPNPITMKVYRLLLLGCMVTLSFCLQAQIHEIDKEQFFLDERPIEAHIGNRFEPADEREIKN